MASEREVTLAARLSQAEAAHGVYEREQLAGVFDEEWPRWYAEYLVAHGVGEVAPELADVERLTVMLAACDAAHRSEGSSEEWEPFYARRMLSGLPAGRLAVEASAGEHSVGPEHAPVTLVEYADFQCPESAAAAPLLRGLRRRLEGRMRLVFRHFPLTHKHPHAQWAAEVAEAAAAQGKFWEMHDQLFVHQNLLGDAHLDLYAARVGLDVSRMREELASGMHAARVRADREGGVRSGVTGTPTFFIGGVLYDGEYETEPLLATLRAAMEQRTALDAMDNAVEKKPTTGSAESG